MTEASAPFFVVCGKDAHSGDLGANTAPRVGRLLGQLPTPRFTLLTSKGMPAQLRPEIYAQQQDGQPQLVQLPIGDVLLRCETVKNCPDASAGCKGFFPHLRPHWTYCSFRNPRLENSVFGGDAGCQVETTSGRRKVPVSEVLDTQRVMRANVVAAPGEEVPLNVTSSRRSTRAVARAAEWLKDIVDAREKDPELKFDWHLLASVQGGADLARRKQACKDASAVQGVAGVWLGGLGYTETLNERARVLDAVTSELPETLPRFLPLHIGTPAEILQAVLLGVDVFEIDYPMQVAIHGFALTFSSDMAADWNVDAASITTKLRALLPPQGALPEDAASESKPEFAPLDVRQIQLRAEEYREDFAPISEDSPVKHYSRAYICHLLELRELLGTQLLVRHNLYMYETFFAAIRTHIQSGSLARFAAWFLETQTSALPESAMPEKTAKKRRS